MSLRTCKEITFPFLLGLLRPLFVDPRVCAAGKRFVLTPRSAAKSNCAKIGNFISLQVLTAYFLLIIFSFSARGQETDASVLSTSAAPTFWKKPKAHLGGGISLWQSHYLSPEADSDMQNNPTELRVHGKGTGPFGELQGTVEVGGRLQAQDFQQSYIWVHQAFLDFSDRSEGLSVGRKRVQWNQVDEVWNLGLWEQISNVDPLEPSRSGLIGVFWRRRIFSNIEFEVLGSPLYIPNERPRFEIEDGKFQSSSRWISPPPESLRLLNGTSPVEYRLERPSTWDVVNQAGGALRIGSDPRKSGLWWQGSFAYKPSQDFYIGLRPYQPINVTVVEIHPVVYHHRLYAMDLGYRHEAVSSTLSAVHERPDSVDLPAGRAGPELYESTALSLTEDINLDALLDLNAELQLSYLRVFENGTSLVGKPVDRTDVLTAVSREANKALPRHRFTNAIQWSVGSKLWRRGNKHVALQFRHIYDFEDRGTVLSPEVRFKPDARWSVFARADLLAGQEGLGFAGRYRSNDRFEGGFEYVF